MVGSDAGAKKPGEKVLSLLERSGLMYSPSVRLTRPEMAFHSR